MSSHARPLLGLTRRTPPSTTSSKQAPVITCHLNNVLMPAPYSLHFYGNLNHAQVWNAYNNEHENAKRFLLTSTPGKTRNVSWGA